MCGDLIRRGGRDEQEAQSGAVTEPLSLATSNGKHESAPREDRPVPKSSSRA
jgi:hypothetical protein